MKQEIFDKYASLVAKHFKISEEELFSDNKNYYVSDARHLFCHLCRGRHSRFTEIFTYMQNRGYSGVLSSVRYGNKTTIKKAKADPDYGRVIKNINRQIN
jgi:chromosomal replication initiation ATPase DnaA